MTAGRRRWLLVIGYLVIKWSLVLTIGAWLRERGLLWVFPAVVGVVVGVALTARILRRYHAQTTEFADVDHT